MPQFARPFGWRSTPEPGTADATLESTRRPRRCQSAIRNPQSPPTRSRVKRYVQRPFLAAAVIAIAAAPTLTAQNPEPRPADSRLFTQRDAVAAGIATAATLALAAFDRPIAESLADTSGRYQRNSFLG